MRPPLWLRPRPRVSVSGPFMKFSNYSAGTCHLFYTRTLTDQPSLAKISSHTFGYLTKMLGASSILTILFPLVALETPCVLLWVWTHVKTQRCAH